MAKKGVMPPQFSKYVKGKKAEGTAAEEAGEKAMPMKGMHMMGKKGGK